MTDRTKEIIFIRHGKSVTNSENIYQAGDQFEIDPLDETGRWQAVAVAKRFESKAFHPDIILSSSYLRAMQTAKEIARITLTKIIAPVIGEEQIARPGYDAFEKNTGKSLFREIDLPSELEGKSYDDEVSLAIKEEIDEHLFEPHWHYSDEENLFDQWNRAKLCLDYLAARTEDRIVVVSHGGLIKACVANMLFASEQEFTVPDKLEAYHAFSSNTWFDNTGVITTDWNPETHKWRWMMSENNHLPGPFGYVRDEHANTSADELFNPSE